MKVVVSKACRMNVLVIANRADCDKCRHFADIIDTPQPEDEEDEEEE